MLRVDFLSSGMQLVTSASDGLVKLWNIRDEACVRTLDNHEDKVGHSQSSPTLKQGSLRADLVHLGSVR